MYCSRGKYSRLVLLFSKTNTLVDGGWSAFGAYGACSKSCGGGLKKRYRTCSNPKPSNGGEQCSGTSEESASCNTKRCPGKKISRLTI